MLHPSLLPQGLLLITMGYEGALSSEEGKEMVTIESCLQVTHSQGKDALNWGQGGNIQRAGSGIQGAGGISRSDRLVKEQGKEEDVVQGLENKLGANDRREPSKTVEHSRT